jgi:hypothetical protein
VLLQSSVDPGFHRSPIEMGEEPKKAEGRQSAVATSRLPSKAGIELNA